MSLCGDMLALLVEALRLKRIAMLRAHKQNLHDSRH